MSPSRVRLHLMWFLALGALGLVVFLTRKQLAATPAAPALPAGPPAATAPPAVKATPSASIAAYDWIGALTPGAAVSGARAGLSGFGDTLPVSTGGSGSGGFVKPVMVTSSAPIFPTEDSGGGEMLGGPGAGSGYDTGSGSGGSSDPVFPEYTPTMGSESESPAYTPVYEAPPGDSYTEPSGGYTTPSDSYSEPSGGYPSGGYPPYSEGKVDYSGSLVSESGAGWVDADGTVHEPKTPVGEGGWGDDWKGTGDDKRTMPIPKPAAAKPAVGEMVSASVMRRSMLDAFRKRMDSGTVDPLSGMGEFFEMLASGAKIEGRVYGYGKGLAATFGKGLADSDEFVIVEVTKSTPGSGGGAPAVGSYVAVG